MCHLWPEADPPPSLTFISSHLLLRTTRQFENLRGSWSDPRCFRVQYEFKRSRGGGRRGRKAHANRELLHLHILKWLSAAQPRRSAAQMCRDVPRGMTSDRRLFKKIYSRYSNQSRCPHTNPVSGENTLLHLRYFSRNNDALYYQWHLLPASSLQCVCAYGCVLAPRYV